VVIGEKMRIHNTALSACLLLLLFILFSCGNKHVPENIISIEIYENSISPDNSKLWSYVITDPKLISGLIGDLKKIKKTGFSPQFHLTMRAENNIRLDLVTNGKIFEFADEQVFYSLDEPLSILSFKAVAEKYSDDLLNGTEWNAEVFGGICSFVFFMENDVLMCTVKIPGSGIDWIINGTFPVNRDGSVLSIGGIQLFPNINGLRMEDTILVKKQ
jgi:hypothetical protein